MVKKSIGEVKQPVYCLDIWIRTGMTAAECNAIGLLWSIVFGPSVRAVVTMKRISPHSYKYRSRDGERLNRFAQVLRDRTWTSTEFDEHRKTTQVRAKLVHMRENGVAFDHAMASARAKMTNIFVGVRPG